MLPLFAAAVLASSALNPAIPTAPPEPTEHCAVEIVAAPDRSATAEDIICFDTEQARDSHVDARTAQPDARRAPASVRLGTIYKGTALTGSSLAFWGTGSCANATYGFDTLAADWVTGIRSASGAGCAVTLYTAPNFGGSFATCAPTCSTLGALSGNTRSLVFRPF